MAKTVFTQAQQLDLTKRLQLMLLDGVAASGNWDSGETARFQGGTCLSLSYGSSRFSEDLDFVLGTDKGLNRLLAGVQLRMTNALRTAAPGASVSFSARDEDLEASSAKNPRTFMMTVSHPDWYRSVKVKVEFWVADPQAVRQYEARVIPAKLLASVLEGVPLRMALPPVMLPTATLQEILVDKLHALACRPYMKHRDVFDLWWLAQQGVVAWQAELDARYPYHALMYNDSPTPQQLLAVLRTKSAEIRAFVGSPDFANELKKWLGEDSTLASQVSADAMAVLVAGQLEQLTAAADPDPGPSQGSAASPAPAARKKIKPS